MNSRIIDTLTEIKDQYGDMVFYNHYKMKNLMHDLAPGLRKERIHISQFLELNGYFQLKYAGHSYSIIRTRLVQDYANTYSVNDDVAIWVVDVFSELLGLSDFKNMNKMIRQDPPESPPSTDASPTDAPEPIANCDQLPPTPDAQKSPSPTKSPSKNGVKGRCVSGGHTFSAAAESGPGSPLAGFGAEPQGPAELQGLDLKTRISADMHSVAVMPDGTVRAVGPNDDGQCNVGKWSDVVAVSCGPHFTVGLKANGKVLACGRNEYGQCDVFWWKDIVAVSAGARHTVGLKADGTVVATGQNRGGECSVQNWHNVVHISAGYQCTFGIKKDYKVLVRGSISEDVVKRFSGVADIVNPYPYRSLVLKRNGRLDTFEASLKGSVSKWRGIVQVSAGPDYFAGLLRDGRVRVLAYYWVPNGIECNPDDWTDIEAIAAGRFHLLGIKKDGSIISAMMHPNKSMNKGQCRVSDWRLV